MQRRSGKDLKLRQAVFLFDAPPSPEPRVRWRESPGTSPRKQGASGRSRSRSPDAALRSQLKVGAQDQPGPSSTVDLPDSPLNRGAGSANVSSAAGQEPEFAASVGRHQDEDGDGAGMPRGMVHRMSSNLMPTLDQQLSEKQRWSMPMPVYRRERAAQAQRARHLDAVQAALQQRAAASELARCFLRGVMAGGLLQLQMLAQSSQEESSPSSLAPLRESQPEVPCQDPGRTLGAVEDPADTISAAVASRSQWMAGDIGGFTGHVSADDEAGAAIEGVIRDLLDAGMA